MLSNEEVSPSILNSECPRVVGANTDFCYNLCSVRETAQYLENGFVKPRPACHGPSYRQVNFLVALVPVGIWSNPRI